jgi:heme oxygenase
MNSVLTERLKKETRKEHANTEGMMNAKAMFSDEYDLDVYTNHLLHLYKAHCIVNTYITVNKSVLPSLALLPEDRSLDLKNDLLNLHCDSLPSNFKIKDNSLFKTLPELLGLIYVVKGSELGGNVIGKQIEKHRLKWDIPPAKFYKTVKHEDLMADWKAWSDKVNLIPCSEEFINASVNSAKRTFKLFGYPEQFGDFDQ